MQPLADLLAADFDVQILTSANVLAENAIPKADFVAGWSMGGMLAIELLPVSCRKLILLASTARFCSTDGYDCGVPQKVLRHMIAQLKRDPAATLEEFYKNVNDPDPVRPCASVKAPVNQLVEGLEYLIAADLRRKVPQIKIPVLLLHGEKDRIIPPEASDWLAQHLPIATCLRLPNDGHHIAALAILPVIRHFLE
jgi:pimeloyl-[acyl-carrier protein] methyl ester esterase